MRKLTTKYEEVKARVKRCLESAAHVCLTTDILTSRATQGYITVTCHFLDELWLMQTFVLETFNLTVSHTAENIAAELKPIANDWLIADKVVALVTDNASNMVAAARLTGWKHIPCFAHTLNLIVQAALSADPVMADLKKKMQEHCNFFHQSTKASDKLKGVQNQIGNSEVKLVQEVETRWNSSFYMFKRVLEQKEPITTTLCLRGKNEMCLSAAELKQLSMAVTILQPFETATTELSAETYVSVSKIIPIAWSLQQVALSNDTSTRSWFLKCKHAFLT